MGFKFNPFTGSLDAVSKQTKVVSSAPTSGTPGILYLMEDYIYYFIGSNRYRVDTILDNPLTLQRLMEDGTIRLMEDGNSRYLETV